MTKLKGVTDEECEALRLIVQLAAGGRWRGQSKVRRFLDGDDAVLRDAPTLAAKLDQASDVIHAALDKRTAARSARHGSTP